jgi:hypothetical protein
MTAAWAQEAQEALPRRRIAIDPRRASSTVAASLLRAVPPPDPGEVSP